jgi:peptide/nickel transport system substrate-binding protein
LHPVCSGPFSFVDRVAQDHLTLERFPDYWDAKGIHFDRIVYQVLPDNSVRLANLQAGTTDITEYLAPTDVATVKADPRLKLAVSDGLGYIGLINNLNLGPRSDTPYGKNALVRQALDAAIDRPALVNVVFNGMFAPNVQSVAPNSPFYDEALPPPPRDVAKARALLRQAGVTLPVTLELLTPNQPDTLQAAEVIQSMAAEAGFDIRIVAMEITAAGPTVDGLLEQGRAMSDIGKRRVVYQQAWAALRRDLPITFLYSPRNIVAMTVKLQGFRPVPDGLIRVQGLEMTK